MLHSREENLQAKVTDGTGRQYKKEKGSSTVGPSFLDLHSNAAPSFIAIIRQIVF